MKEILVHGSDRMVVVDDDVVITKRLYLSGTRRGINTSRNESIASLVMGKPPVGFQWDHKDGNIYNNLRYNLRLATDSQQQANRRKFSGRYSSKYKGVSFKHGKFEAYCNRIYLGRYVDEDDAGRAYDKKAIELWGEFAVLNFP